MMFLWWKDSTIIWLAWVTVLKINFRANKCSRASKDNSQSITSRRHGNIYLLDLECDDIKCLVSIRDETFLWQRKMGTHKCQTNLQTIIEKPCTRIIVESLYEDYISTNHFSFSSLSSLETHISTNRVSKQISKHSSLCQV